MEQAHDAEQTGSAGQTGPLEPTGHRGVDQVLATLDGLGDREVHEHVEVFEQAHAALRRALDEPGDSQD